MRKEDNPDDKIRKLKNKIIEVTIYKFEDAKYKKFLADHLEREDFDLNYPKHLISLANLDDSEKLGLFMSLLKDLKKIKNNENPDFEYYLNDGRDFAETVYDLGDIELAKEWYEFLLELYDIDINFLGLARCYINLKMFNEGISTLLNYLVKSAEIYGKNENDDPKEISYAKQTVYRIIADIFNEEGEKARKIIETELIRKEKEKNSREVIGLIVDINDIYKKKGNAPIFKLTDKILKEHDSLSKDINDKKSFEALITFLYYLLYEGSGGKDNRVPPTIVQDNHIVKRIKNLRNLQFGHDIDHGKSKEIKKKHKLIGDILNNYAKKSSLSEFCEDDYRKISKKIISDVLFFLKTIKQKCMI